MNHRVWVLVGSFLLGVIGCAHQQTRMQAEDEGDRDLGVKTIGDLTTIGNAEPIPVSGVGLVVGLEGTGGGAPAGGYRSMLEDYLRKRSVPNVKEVLSSPANALVIVSAVIPAGAHKGDPIDVEVSLPPGSKATSLRGGRLLDCPLYNYDTTQNLNPNHQGGNRGLLGHALARAEGPLLVGFGDGDAAARVRQGRIWGGGKSNVDMPFYLVLNNDCQSSRLSMQVAGRINATFQGDARGAPGTELAQAKTRSVVYVSVPHQYRHYLSRYLRVVRLIPMLETPANSPYRRRLEEDLLDPSRTITAALRLESLGSDTIPALKRGLQSEHVVVRFASAEALAYLGSPSSGEELARLVEQQPLLRAYCLTAMASLDEAVCHVRLRELLGSASAETRFGAFRALRTLDEQEPSIRGEMLNDSFWLHRVMPNSPPLVHMSTSRRAEVVLFGEEPRLEPPFSFLAGPEYTVTAGQEDDRCTVSRFSAKTGTRRKQCSLKLEDVIRTLAELGGHYPDVVELLCQVERCNCLSCKVRNDALPQAIAVQELARNGANHPELLKTDEEILNARADLGATPTLYERPTGRRPRLATAENDEETQAKEDNPRKEKKTGERRSASDL